MSDLIPWLFILPPALVALIALGAVAFGRTRRGKAHELMVKGGQHLHRKELAEAEALFREGLALQPEHVGLLGTLGSLLVSEGRYEEALPLLEKALTLAPDDMPMRLVMGRCQQAMGQEARAVELWASIPESDPVYIDAQGLLATYWEAQGEREMAIASLEAAISRATVHEARPFKKELARLRKGEGPAPEAKAEAEATEGEEVEAKARTRRGRQT